jgi:L-alanine-DL-glutamate epimerase-like enolase superfamily enzyme
MPTPVIAVPRIRHGEAYALGMSDPGSGWSGDVPQPHTLTTILRITDDSGNQGIGATSTYSERAHDLSVLETLNPLLHSVADASPWETEALARAGRRHPLPVSPGALSALDIAMWDLAAKQVDLPLYRLLGGAAASIPAYASTPFLGTTDAYLEATAELRNRGFRGIKFHAWGEPERDLALLHAVREAYPDSETTFMLDAEQRYDRGGAARVARAMARLQCGWLEAPLDDHDLRGYQELRRKVDLPILCSGNWIWQLPSVLGAAQAGSWDALHFDVTVCGGITAGRKLAALAEASGLGIELQSWGHTLVQAANLHLALGCGRAEWFEYAVPAASHRAAVCNPIEVDERGLVHPPSGPGLGIELDWDRVRAQALASRTWHPNATPGCRCQDAVTR